CPEAQEHRPRAGLPQKAAGTHRTLWEARPRGDAGPLACPEAQEHRPGAGLPQKAAGTHRTPEEARPRGEGGPLACPEAKEHRPGAGLPPKRPVHTEPCGRRDLAAMAGRWPAPKPKSIAPGRASHESSRYTPNLWEARPRGDGRP